MRSFLPVMLLIATIVAPAVADEYLWCIDEDVVSAEVDPVTAVITIFHDAALYNCCPDPISYDVQFGAMTFFVVEQVAADPPCDCDCCYDLAARIIGASPGDWFITFSWLNLETGVWLQWHGGVVVPNVGQELSGEVEIVNSGCLSSIDVAQSTWGALKSLYR
jgi:hypothetical protein